MTKKSQTVNQQYALYDDGRNIPDYIVRRLEEAGVTLMTLPPTTPQLGFSISGGGVWSLDAPSPLPLAMAPTSPGPTRCVSTAAQITRMDQAHRWLVHITNLTIRRIVAARSLIWPLTREHRFSWAQIAETAGADYRAVKRWHAVGIEMIALSKSRQEWSGQVS